MLAVSVDLLVRDVYASSSKMLLLPVGKDSSKYVGKSKEQGRNKNTMGLSSYISISTRSFIHFFWSHTVKERQVSIHYYALSKQFSVMTEGTAFRRLLSC